MFKLADKIEARVAAATLQAEKLTQAILAKAFRGELVPTEAELAREEDREYEPASVLLERIRAERTAIDDNHQATRSSRAPQSRTAARVADTKGHSGETQDGAKAAAPRKDNAGGVPITSAERPTPIDQTDRDDVMAVIRDVFASGGARSRDQAIRDVATELGYKRAGSRIVEILDKDLRTGVRRGILENAPEGLRLLCRQITEYERDFLIEQLTAGMGAYLVGAR